MSVATVPSTPGQKTGYRRPVMWSAALEENLK